VYSGWPGVAYYFLQVAIGRWTQMGQWELQSRRWEPREVVDEGLGREPTLMAGQACSMAVGNGILGRMVEELPQSG